jgi:hypothetical protein
MKNKNHDADDASKSIFAAVTTGFQKTTSFADISERVESFASSVDKTLSGFLILFGITRRSSFLATPG